MRNIKKKKKKKRWQIKKINKISTPKYVENNNTVFFFENVKTVKIV